MARRKRGQPVHGWVIIDKSTGLQSTETANRVRRLFDAQKAGHGGTLDPLATGVLAVALGEATKTVPYVMDGPKTYQFTVAFGAATDSDDVEGDVIDTSD
ncbi:MAG: tRNA pseudouridine(55) synthase TruB, partial [Alphaproteobacteria bacterium]